MNTPNSAPGSSDEIIARLLRELETAPDPGAVLARFCVAHPRLADEMRKLAAMPRKVDAASPPAGPAVPHRLGDFQIIRQVAHGGMGEVYEAMQERLHRRVALKVIRQGRTSAEARERFEREQAVLARLHQTHIVPIHTAGEEGPIQYFAMPFIAGAALHDVVRTAWQMETSARAPRMPTLAQLATLMTGGRNGAEKPAPEGPAADPHGATRDESAPTADRSPSEKSDKPEPLPGGDPAAPAGKRFPLSPEYFRSVAEVMADAAEAVQHAHEAQVLHRDLKPSNIMVDTAGHCWLIDFGLAGYLAAAKEAAPAGQAPREPPLASGVLGTPQYMAPEQAQGRADARTDVWGLGVTLYELLTLRRPFGGQSLAGSSGADPQPPRRLVVNVPADLEAVCRKALNREPDRRYQTAREFGEDLRRWLRHEPTRARPAWLLRRLLLWARRNKGWAAAIGAALAAAVALIFVLKIQADRETERAVSAIKRVAQLRREALVKQLERIRSGTRLNGWSDKAWRMAAEAAEIRKDEELRDQAAAALVGLDAFPSKEFRKVRASAVALDPQGTRLLMGGRDDQEARLWDSTTHQTVLSGRTGFGPVAFRADGTPLQLVFDPKKPRTLLLWDVARRRPIREFPFPAKAKPADPADPNVPCPAMTPDGAFIAAGTLLDAENVQLAVWETATGKLLHRFKTRSAALALSPDGTRLASGGPDGRITVWSLPTGDSVATFRGNGPPINCLAFGPDLWRRGGNENRPGKRRWLLASGEAGGRVAVWDFAVPGPTIRSICYGARFDIYSLAFSPDGALLGGGAHDGAMLWDVAAGRLLLDLNRHQQNSGLTFSGDGKRLAVSSLNFFNNFRQGPWVGVWDLQLGRGLRMLHGLGSPISRVTYSRDGKLLAALSHSWQVAVWDVHNGSLLHVFDAPRGRTADNAGLTFNPGGTKLACASGRGAKVWDLRLGKEIRSWRLPEGLMDVLFFHPTGKLVLFRVDIPDPNRPRLVCRVRALEPGIVKPLYDIKDFHRSIYAAVATPNGRYLAAEGLTGRPGERPKIVLLDALSGKEVWRKELRSRQGNAVLLVDPKGEVLEFADEVNNKGQPFFLEVSSGRLLGTTEWRPVTLGPKGSYWARATKHFFGYSLFHWWGERPLVTLDIDSSGQGSLGPVFNATGNEIAWGNSDGTVTVCDIPEVNRRLTRAGLGGW